MFTLDTEKRSLKTRTDAMRKRGKIPAVFYGRKEKPTPVTLSYNDFLKAWKTAGESTIISLAYDGRALAALIHDVAIDPVKGNPIHVDFYIVEADRAVEVDIPLVFSEEAPAAKELGGTLVKVLHEVLVSGLPKDLPHEIIVPISSLTTLESRILVKDLKVPEGVSIKTSPLDIVASISLITHEEEEVAPAEFDASAVLVEKKGKQEEEEPGVSEEEASKDEKK